MYLGAVENEMINVKISIHLFMFFVLWSFLCVLSTEIAKVFGIFIHLMNVWKVVDMLK